MASPKRFTAAHFNTREYQVQRKNHFEIQFENTAESKVDINSDLTLMVTSFSLPKEETESFEAPYFNQKVKLAGLTSFNDGTLVIKDVLGKDTESIFQGWRKLVYNPQTGIQGYASDYKISAIVTEYSPDGTFAREWKLEGCWPSAVDYGDLDMGDGGEKTINVTIKYDYAYRK